MSFLEEMTETGLQTSAEAQSLTLSCPDSTLSPPAVENGEKGLSNWQLGAMKRKMNRQPIVGNRLTFMSETVKGRKMRQNCLKCGHKWYSRVVKPRACPNCKRTDYRQKVMSGAKRKEMKAKRREIARWQKRGKVLDEILIAGGMGGRVERTTLRRLWRTKPEVDWRAICREAVAERPEDLYMWLLRKGGLV